MRKLTLDTANAKIGGVCGGLGKFFEIDPVIIRLLFVLGVCVTGTGIGVYIICWLVIPKET